MAKLKSQTEQVTAKSKQCLGLFVGDVHKPCLNEVEPGEDWCEWCGSQMDIRFDKALRLFADPGGVLPADADERAIDEVVGSKKNG